MIVFDYVVLVFCLKTIVFAILLRSRFGTCFFTSYDADLLLRSSDMMLEDDDDDDGPLPLLDDSSKRLFDSYLS